MREQSRIFYINDFKNPLIGSSLSPTHMYIYIHNIHQYLEILEFSNSVRDMDGFVGFTTRLVGQHHGLNSQWTASHTDPRSTRAAGGPEPSAKCVILLMGNTL